MEQCAIFSGLTVLLWSE